jgi:ABC-2 type transport system permease protein
MSKIIHVAIREFLSTVLTKGFIIGVLMTPLIVAAMLILLPLLMNEEAPRVEGRIAVIDNSGEVTAGMAEWLEPEAIASRRAEITQRIDDATPDAAKALGADGAGAAFEAFLGEVPLLTVEELPVTSSVDDAKQGLLEDSEVAAERLLALVVVEANATVPDADGDLGAYELFTREKVDDRVLDEIRSGMRSSIVAARVEKRGLDPDEIKTLTRVRRVGSVTVTDKGETKGGEVLNILLPAGFMMLLLVSVFTGGQYLMTTTVEEKSSRVVEVLLSAVSPMQLMTGKIIGQMAVGIVILGLYSGMGVAALISFAVGGLVDFWLLVYLAIFYVIAYFVLGSLMAAIGAAVNEMREAQTLMTPIMVTIMIPWLLWMPITRNPNSMFATVTSFLPPINPFVMMLRMTSTTPPPLWQVWLSIAIGIASIFGALWFAAKVFRIGLLMHGKPPSFGTLLKWVRMA